MSQREETGTPKIRRWVSFLFKMPIAVIGLLGGVYAILLIVRFKEDTTSITNGTFAIMATLAALSFSFARVVETEAVRDRLMFAGGRLLHGALLVLVASIIKYFILLLYKIPTFTEVLLLQIVTSCAFSFFGAVLLACGVISVH